MINPPNTPIEPLGASSFRLGYFETKGASKNERSRTDDPVVRPPIPPKRQHGAFHSEAISHVADTNTVCVYWFDNASEVTEGDKLKRPTFIHNRFQIEQEFRHI